MNSVISTHIILPNGEGHYLTGIPLLFSKLIGASSSPNKIIVRGLPGSGKSTLAQDIVDFFEKEYIHVEADMYHYVNGEYKFNPDNLGRAHQWCYNTYRIFDTVVVSNTFVDFKSFSVDWDVPGHYILDEPVKPFVITCLNDFGTIHGVPEKTQEKMRNRFVSPEEIQKVYYGK